MNSRKDSKKGVADLKYNFLIVWRAPRAMQSKNYIWIKQHQKELQDTVLTRRQG